MKSKKRFSHILIYVLLAFILIGSLVTKILFDAGELGPVLITRSLTVIYKNITGAEDLTTVDEGRVVLASVFDRQDIGESKVTPGIYRYSGDADPRLLFPTKGVPHGIASYPTERGSRVYVVVHNLDEDDSVNILDWSSADQTLTLVKKISFPEVRSLNAVVGMSGNRFLVSQDLKLSPGLWQEVEKTLRLPFGKIWYYDEASEKPVVAREDILYANGLALSKDEKHVFVASTTGRSLIDFELTFDETKHPVLKWQREWPLKTAPDNLKWSGDQLLIGTHRKLMTLFLHAFDAKRFRAPSQVIAVRGLPSSLEIEEVHATKSGGLEGISAAVALHSGGGGNRIVMGGVWSPGLLDCAATPPSPSPSPSTGVLGPAETTP